jgi:hypothetical protein
VPAFLNLVVMDSLGYARSAQLRGAWSVKTLTATGMETFLASKNGNLFSQLRRDEEIAVFVNQKSVTGTWDGFHRFVHGDARKIAISLNGNTVKERDPFLEPTRRRSSYA